MNNVDAKRFAELSRKEVGVLTPDEMSFMLKMLHDEPDTCATLIDLGYEGPDGESRN